MAAVHQHGLTSRTKSGKVKLCDSSSIMCLLDPPYAARMLDDGSDNFLDYAWQGLPAMKAAIPAHGIEAIRLDVRLLSNMSPFKLCAFHSFWMAHYGQFCV